MKTPHARVGAGYVRELVGHAGQFGNLQQQFGEVDPGQHALARWQNGGVSYENRQRLVVSPLIARIYPASGVRRAPAVRTCREGAVSVESPKWLRIL